MSYVVLRHEKLKSTSKGVAASHNHRTGEAIKQKHAPNIDTAYSHLNKPMFKGGASAMVKRINAKLPTKRRKDAVECVEVILSASPDFFNKIETDREKLSTHPDFIKWCTATVKWAKSEYGDNIVDFTLHMDEKTPHFHIAFVPLTTDNRLCGKQVLAKAELIRRQSDYALVMSPFGLKRGLSAEVTKREHVSLKEDRKNTKMLSSVPPIPSKEGITDFGYADRLLEYAMKLKAAVEKLLKERKRVQNLELLLSKGVIELEDVKKLQLEIKLLNNENYKLKTKSLALTQQNMSLVEDKAKLTSKVKSLHEEVEILKPEPAMIERKHTTAPRFNPQARS